MNISTKNHDAKLPPQGENNIKQCKNRDNDREINNNRDKSEYENYPELSQWTYRF
ncbi:hypothetical protein [Photorhabdus stackebrandtii]|uniref:hypothetical protein n=1 Tax=Photorhabdus stackebrandtii TaxID=1123042 RepID=UPI00140B181A|nr:hypothetical protein [Photorhabdus stackebrandtii]